MLQGSLLPQSTLFPALSVSLPPFLGFSIHSSILSALSVTTTRVFLLRTSLQLPLLLPPFTLLSFLLPLHLFSRCFYSLALTKAFLIVVVCFDFPGKCLKFKVAQFITSFFANYYVSVFNLCRILFGVLI